MTPARTPAIQPPIFAGFLATVPPRSDLRSAITAHYRTPEAERMAQLVAEATLPTETVRDAQATARRLIGALREKGTRGPVQGLVREYDLSSQEGIALMCLAEALLRIPDRATRDALIRDKISGGDWRAHAGQSPSLFVNAATWGLVVTGKLVGSVDEGGLSAALGRLIARGGEPVIRKGVDLAMRVMGEQFVTGQMIEEALRNSRRLEAKGFRYSYDMLGEAAVTAEDAARYFRDYERAIHAIGRAAQGRGIYDGPGISVKLSALHPRYSRLQRERVMEELLPRLAALAVLARGYNIGLNIDAEEAERLEISLDLLEALCLDERLAGWNGIGFVVQAYQKRAPFVLDWVIDLARRTRHRLMIRLVKGAYWDSEIKRAQVDGLDDFPVFTRKLHTDVSYLACARKLLGAADAVFPQFATHNAYTVAAVHAMAGGRFHAGQYEFQCLHGMGEPLYEEVVGHNKLGRPCRVYAPVGTHETLLAYLVRRLLENGANSSFVNRIRDQPRAHFARPRQQLQRVGGHARRVEDPDRLRRDERRLLGRLGEDCVARSQRRRDLPGEDGEREVPRADAHNRAERDVRPVVEGVPHLGAVVAEEVHRFPDLGNGVGHRLAGLADDQAEQVRRARLQRVGGAGEDRGPLRRGHPLPDLSGRRGARQGGVHLFRHRLHHVAHQVAPVRGVADRLRRAVPRALRGGFPGAGGAAGEGGGEVVQRLLVAQVEARRVGPLRAEQVARQADARMRRADRRRRRGERDGIGGKLLVRHAAVLDPRTRGVLFTGSTEVARLIQKQLARRLNPDGAPVPLIAETGGQNALVVDSSALAEQVVADVLVSAFDSAGQRCSALRVLCLQEDVADRTLHMLKGAVAELAVGNPDRLSTDVGPVISAEARDGILGHVEAMRAAGRPVHQGPLQPGHEHGTFVPPTIIEITSLSELKREVFGPVLHVLRFPRDGMDALIDAVNATGYGLTFGVHTRIDETVARAVARAGAGNVYVNRNLVGAVVGVQPFGGHGLSGTGPKAGGPLYLRRLLSRRSAAAFPAGPVLPAATAWEGLSAGAAPARRDTPVGVEMTLAGPVGEENLYRTEPRGAVLCRATSREELLRQIGAALATGNRALVPADQLGALPALPQPFSDLIAGVTDPDLVGFDTVLFEGGPDTLVALAQDMAGRPGPIVPVHVAGPDGDYPLEWLVRERALSANTTAAGGNANLMMIG